MIFSIIIGLFLESAAAIIALKRVLTKSNTAFFLIFVGDALIKMASLILATWWLWSRGLPYTGPLLTLGFVLLLLSLAPIPFLYQAH
jgi:hypothetical protein